MSARSRIDIAVENGSVIIVSHDIRFLNKICKALYQLGDGALRGMHTT